MELKGLRASFVGRLKYLSPRNPFNGIESKRHHPHTYSTYRS